MPFFGELPPLTIAFILIILGLTIWMVFFKYDHRTISLGPAFLTTFGIFGCFLGIAIGLLNFDVNNIQGSVPALINGIKTSFWASVCGIFGALLIKLRVLISGWRHKDRSEFEGATIDDLASLLSDVQSSIAGEDDSTLVGQTKLLRQDINDRLSRLQQSYDQFAEKMADSNSKALIQALEEVIRDFNTKINEQFGENFKQLNAAVEKMVIWQEQYRQQMAEMIEQQQVCTVSMTEATQRYSELLKHAETFVDTSTSLHTLMKELNIQRNSLESSLKSLGELLIKASGSLPEIEQKIVDMTEQISSGVRSNHDLMNATIKTVSQSLQTTHTEMKKLLSEVIQSANKELGTQIKQISEDTREQVVALDRAMNDELTKSIETLGRQLTALSQKFVEDYSPLTDQLREVVQIASHSRV